MLMTLDTSPPDITARYRLSLVRETVSPYAGEVAEPGEDPPVARPAETARSPPFTPSITSPPPRALGLFDDVLTTGAHFKAAQRVLQHRFPGIPIAGIFPARTPHTSSRTGGTECRTLSSWVRR